VLTTGKKNCNVYSLKENDLSFYKITFFFYRASLRWPLVHVMQL